VFVTHGDLHIGPLTNIPSKFIVHEDENYLIKITFMFLIYADDLAIL
jgi:hypothetical protein